jgi:neurabin
MQLQEYYVQHLQEKDTEYNALVKKLKDRVIHLEQELQDTQRTAGLPVILPYDSSSLKLTPQMSRKQPPTTFYQKLETEFSDTEISDLSPDGEDGKTATVERKVPAKDEFDTAVPQTQLLDTSVIKSKSGLARGGLAKRQLPTGKKSHSNSGSDGGLDGSEEEEEVVTDSTSITHSDQAGTYYTNGHYSTPNISAIQQRIQNSLQQQSPSAAPPLYAQVHKERTDGAQAGNAFTTHSTIPNIYR